MSQDDAGLSKHQGSLEILGPASPLFFPEHKPRARQGLDALCLGPYRQVARYMVYGSPTSDHLEALYRGLIPTLDLSLSLVLGVASFPALTRWFLTTLGYYE